MKPLKYKTIRKKENKPVVNLWKLSIFYFLATSYFLLTTFCSAYSQAEQIKFDRLSTEQGLSSGEIMSITQDQKGFMWIGTYDGLNMYDGYKFTIFKSSNRLSR